MDSQVTYHVAFVAQAPAGESETQRRLREALLEKAMRRAVDEELGARGLYTALRNNLSADARAKALAHLAVLEQAATTAKAACQVPALQVAPTVEGERRCA